MRRQSSNLQDLNKRVEQIERYLWGDRIDDRDFETPGPPHPGGLHGWIEDIERALEEVRGDMPKMKTDIEELHKHFLEVAPQQPAAAPAEA